MALTKCEECKKEVSTKAKACPHCGAPIKEKIGCFGYLSAGVFLIFFIAVVYNLFTDDPDLPDSPNTTSSILESSALKNIKKDTETQAKRKDLIDDLISQDIFKRKELLGQYLAFM